MTGTESESWESTFPWQNEWSLHVCHAKLLEMGYGVKLFYFFSFFKNCFESFQGKIGQYEIRSR